MMAIVLSAIVVSKVATEKRQSQILAYSKLQQLALFLGSSDLAITTEARYTRHVAVSDQVVVEMDHPGAIDHFTSSTFFQPMD